MLKSTSRRDRVSALIIRLAVGKFAVQITVSSYQDSVKLALTASCQMLDFGKKCERLWHYVMFVWYQLFVATLLILITGAMA